MGNAGGQELVGFIWQVLNHKMLHLKKKFQVFEIRGHAFARQKSIMICF